jgi:toxin CptA
MPRTPTTIRVVPSRLAWCSQALLALMVTAAVLYHAPDWLMIPALAWLGPLGWWLWHGQVRGELHMLPEPNGGWCWLWQPASVAEAQPARLRCTYLGPWLIALELDGRRTWLWPDSAPHQALRQLRRALAQ